MTEPIRDRPRVPQGYGVPTSDEGILDWESVEERLQSSTEYWLATTRPDGRPHVVPRWGIWLDGRFWYDGALDTVHAMNLHKNSACVLHLEDGQQAVIVEGNSRAATPPDPELAKRLSEAMSRKYGSRGYSPKPDAWDGPKAGGLRVMAPTKAMAWFDFPNDVTRFTF